MATPEVKHIVVVGAVIVRDGLVLCAKRGPGGETGHLWEFPGGKVEPGEAPADALTREIVEELGCHVRVGDEVAATTHEYGFGVITLTTYYCELIDGTPTATQHAELAWLAPNKLDSLGWAPADVPAVERLQQLDGRT
ncbi:MAG: (deoxy)nucleoside triphosphate pyrophosphohydrolase [Propionibacteriales bacterium]|nr:(deoxy)nucleoside triphosphate pyrophosphohydrolase [Propionibacteriales bacterium]